jgi:hypothetical protein
MRPILDPRDGDIEDDASSTHQRSLLSLAGSLFSEISLPKLFFVWILLLVVPALLLGVAPLLVSAWAIMVWSKTANVAPRCSEWVACTQKLSSWERLSAKPCLA